MAKVTGPLHSTQASGTIDGVVYSRNQYGAYTRSPGSWVDPNTTEQQAWRGVMSSINSSWQTLATSQPWLLQNWGQFAGTHTAPNKLGEQKRLSAKAWFIRQNMYRVYSGLATQNTPPDPYPQNYYPELYFIWDTNGIYVDCWPRPLSEQLIYVSKVPFQSQARFFCPNKTTLGVMIDSSTTLPYLLWTSGEVGTAARRWFFKYVAVDSQGSHGSAIFDWIDTSGTAPSAFYPTITDTYLWLTSPNSNFGNIATILIDEAPTGTLRSLVNIDTSSAPSKIAKKFLLFYKFSNTITSVGYVNFHLVLEEWNAAQATWNNRLTATPWNTAGMGSGSDYLAQSDLLQFGTNDQSDWNRFDISRIANQWLDATYTNYGINLIGANTGSFWAYHSINAASAANRPYCFALYG